MLEIFGVGRHLDVLVIELSFFGCFFLAGMTNGGVERNFSLALWLTWCWLRNSSWLVWPAGYLAVDFCGQAAGEPRCKTGKEQWNVGLQFYLVEDVWLFVADLIRPKRTGDFPHPNTRRNLSLNLNESGCSLLYYAQSIMLTYLEDIVL